MVQFSRQRRGREFLEYVAHIAVLRPKSYAHFEQHSPSRGAHGAKETSGITSRTARIDAKWKYAPRACFGRQSGQRRSSISRCNVRRLGCDWRSGAARAHPFRRVLPSRLSYGSTSIRRHHDARRSGDFSLSSSERWGARTPRDSKGSGNGMTGTGSGSVSTSVFATAT
jgi:hypothetical protein